MKKNEISREFFSIPEASAYIGLSERTIRALLNDTIYPIPHYRIGSARRLIKIKRSELDSWMKSQKVNQKDEIDRLIADLIK